MSAEEPDPEPNLPVLPPPAGAPAAMPATSSAPVPRNTVADTWGWLWKDTVGRCLPFALGAAAYAKLSGAGPSAIGLTGIAMGRDVALGVALGIPMLAVAVAFRAWDAPRYRLPTAPDQALQTAFYFGVNAPAEELFWRGTVQTLAIKGISLLGPLAPVAAALGWAATTAVFGAYHRLGNWSWRSIAGVTVAGGAFGLLYLAAPGGSILPVVIVHGFATAGYLSWGDAALHALKRLRMRRGPA